MIVFNQAVDPRSLLRFSSSNVNHGVIFSATDLCGAVGPTYNSTTLAFKPDELMTAMAWSSNPEDNWLPWPPYIENVFSSADWGAERNCTTITSSWYQGEDNAEYPNYSAATKAMGTSMEALEMLNLWVITYNPCSPTLSVPTQLFKINSLWKGCMQGIDAFYDPLYPLTSGGVLQPFKPTPAPVAQPTEATADSAAPAAGPSADPKIASSTTSSKKSDPSPAGNSEPNDDPTKSDTASNDSPSSDYRPADTAVKTHSANSDPAKATNYPVAPNSESVSTVDSRPSSTTPSAPNLETPSAYPTTSLEIKSSLKTSISTSSDPAPSQSADGNDTPSSYTSSKPSDSSPSTQTILPAVATIGSSTITANSASAFILGS